MSDLSFPDLGYTDDKLNKLWVWIRDDLAERGRVYNHIILENADQCPVNYPDSTLEKDLLPKLRIALEEKNLITVEPEDGEGGMRKRWNVTEE